MPSPVLHQGHVLVGGENRGVRSIEPTLDDGVWTVQERWYQPEVALDMSTAVVNNDLLFGFSHYGAGRLFCLDIETGKVLWQGPGRTGDNVAFLAIPEFILALIDDGELRVIAARGDRYDQVASYQVADAPTWAPPVLLERGVLVKDQTSLNLWTLPEPDANSPSQ
jgi:hypothetical protein